MNLIFLLGAFVALALLVGIAVVSLLVLFALFAKARAKQSLKFEVWSVVGTMTVAALLAGSVVYGYYIVFGPYDPTTPVELAQAYEADFGTLPPPGIKVLKARQVIVGDAGGQWLLLEATPEEIENHIDMGFRPAETTHPDFRSGTGPSWWQPQSGQLEIYEHFDWSKAGGWDFSKAAIGVDRQKGLIWFVADKHS